MSVILSSVLKLFLYFIGSHNKDGYFDSLNGADIDMPEWMFSKIMRSAKIRFADHSMLRVIQILGKFGNWRRVLQVIEWIQSRERFKSHKLRYNNTYHLLFSVFVNREQAYDLNVAVKDG